MAIEIIFAPPRAGKTVYMTHRANITAYDHDRNCAMQSELQSKILAGFDNIHTIPCHCVSANYDITLKKFRYTPRHSRRINPYRLGFNNPLVKTHFNIPYEFICITEAQKYFNSRMSKNYPDWQSRWFEQHGHNNLDILLDTQRPGLIDLNIRELSSFTHIVKLDISYDRFGRPNRLEWLVRHIANLGLFEKYMASGQTDKSCYDEEKVIAEYNVFGCYDSRSCKPKFYQGHFDEDIDYTPSEPTEQSLAGYIKFLEEFDDELPKGFYDSKKER